jgi:protein SCO1/2
MRPLLPLVLILAAACNRGSDAAPAASSAPASASAPTPAAAKPADSAMVDHYTAHGTVKSIDPDKKKLTIAHDDIPGFMKAMTMPFEVKDGALLSGIAVGDSVDFAFTDDGSGHLVVDKLAKK